MPNIKEEVLSFIVKKLKMDPSRISESSYLMADLGLSSIRSMELVCDFEDHFKLRIPDEEIHKMIRVDDLIAFTDQQRSHQHVEHRTEGR